MNDPKHDPQQDSHFDPQQGPQQSPPQVLGTYAVEAHGLTKRFGNFVACDAVSFKVARGEIFGFLGANGAGKTTAIRMLCGLSKPSSGSATVAGLDLLSSAEKVKQRIGYMSQRFSLYADMTVRENIRFFGGVYGLKRSEIRERSDALIERLELKAYTGRSVGGLPLGWKQKLAFSVALLHEPDIVFLDEPTGGVDPVTRRKFWEMIYEAARRGVTVFVTTHYMDEVEYCDRAGIMVDGKLVACDTPAALKAQFAVDSMDAVFLRLARPQKSTP